MLHAYYLIVCSMANFHLRLFTVELEYILAHPKK